MDLVLELAGVGSRSYAFVTDWHVRLLFVLAWLGLVLLIFGADALGNDFDLIDEGLTWAVYFVSLPPLLVYFLYHPVLEILMQGRTPGKRLAGVRIVTADGRTPGVGAVLVRNLFRLVDSLPGFYLIGLAVALATKHKVRVGDLAAGTILVYESRVRVESVRTATRLALSRSLPAADQELLLDLLERWGALQRARRIHLARRFLVKVGEAVPQEDSPAAVDRALFARLTALADRA
jgi:uncharacterized RDD family membrane protein YckC